MSNTLNVDLNGSSYDLRLDADSALALSRRFGGLLPLIGELGSLNPGLTFDVLSIATYRKAEAAGDAKKRLAKLQTDLFSAGASMSSLAAVRYVSAIMNGGREAEALDEEEPEEVAA